MTSSGWRTKSGVWPRWGDSESAVEPSEHKKGSRYESELHQLGIGEMLMHLVDEDIVYGGVSRGQALGKV